MLTRCSVSLQLCPSTTPPRHINQCADNWNCLLTPILCDTFVLMHIWAGFLNI